MSLFPVLQGSRTNSQAFSLSADSYPASDSFSALAQATLSGRPASNCPPGWRVLDDSPKLKGAVIYERLGTPEVFLDDQRITSRSTAGNVLGYVQKHHPDLVNPERVIVQAAGNFPLSSPLKSGVKGLKSLWRKATGKKKKKKPSQPPKRRPRPKSPSPAPSSSSPPPPPPPSSESSEKKPKPKPARVKQSERRRGGGGGPPPSSGRSGGGTPAFENLPTATLSGAGVFGAADLIYHGSGGSLPSAQEFIVEVTKGGFVGGGCQLAGNYFKHIGWTSHPEYIPALGIPIALAANYYFGSGSNPPAPALLPRADSDSSASSPRERSASLGSDSSGVGSSASSPRERSASLGSGSSGVGSSASSPRERSASLGSDSSGVGSSASSPRERSASLSSESSVASSSASSPRERPASLEALNTQISALETEIREKEERMRRLEGQRRCYSPGKAGRNSKRACIQLIGECNQELLKLRREYQRLTAMRNRIND